MAEEANTPHKGASNDLGSHLLDIGWHRCGAQHGGLRWLVGGEEPVQEGGALVGRFGREAPRLPVQRLDTRQEVVHIVNANTVTTNAFYWVKGGSQVFHKLLHRRSHVSNAQTNSL